ncbi:MAG: hypothetical protein JW791_01655 [Nanoarchaeota archaeon]|nr:hypothetical protein [Nanoarchaeota archaeon]
MNLKQVFPYLCLFIVLLSQFNFGADLTHHAHNTWIYNKMISEQRLILLDPYLLKGQQLTFFYGIITYPLSGLLYLLFSNYTVDVFMAIITVIDFILLYKILGKNRVVFGVIILSLLFHTIGDTLVAHFSNMLFWWGVYAYYKKKKFWQLPFILSALNHPFTLLVALYFGLKDKKLFCALLATLSYFIILSLIFSKNSNFNIYLPAVFIVRMLILLAPAAVKEDYFRNSKNKIIKKVSSFLSCQITVYELILIISSLTLLTIVVCSSLFIITGHYFVLKSIDDVSSRFFEGFPEINGTLRIMDYYWLPFLIYDSQGFTSTSGSFRENNLVSLIPPTHIVEFEKNEYSDMIIKEGINYVLYCKECYTKSNEKDLLDSYYNLVWENDYYLLYEVS